ncbi:MAG: hypothetical protein ACKPDM_29335 [Dolichospermum sp.]
MESLRLRSRIGKDGLDWVFLGNEPMQTAQGESRFNIYLGKVILDGKEYEIPVHLGDNTSNFN